MERDDITAALQQKLDPAHVKPPPQGKYGEYIEGYHAICEANRIFGHDGWGYYVDRLQQTNATLDDDGKHHVGYLAIVTVNVPGYGQPKQDVGHGQGHGKSEGDAHDSAVKESVTDALKRALRTFGNPFGLALYDKTKAQVGRDVPQHLLEAVYGAETLQSLHQVWTANREWQTHPDFCAAKDERKRQLEQEQA